MSDRGAAIAAPRHEDGVRRGPRRAAVGAVGAVCLLLALILGGAALVTWNHQRAAPVEVVGAEAALAEGFTVWERNADGTPVRFDPCSPIEVVLNPDGAPPSAHADLDEAVARVAAASGLDLALVGTTDEPPSDPRLPYQPERYGERWAPVLVTWARPGEPGVTLRDTDRGIAAPVAVGPEGERTYVSGQVVLNADRRDLRPGFGDRRDAWGATLLHELAHLVGLGHVDDPDQLMHTYPGEGEVAFGMGDRAGLAAVGADHGCREVPTPAPVRVRRPVGGGHGVP